MRNSDNSYPLTLKMVWKAESLVCILYSPKVQGIGESCISIKTKLIFVTDYISLSWVWLSWYYPSVENEGLSKLWGWGWELASESSWQVEASPPPPTSDAHYIPQGVLCKGMWKKALMGIVCIIGYIMQDAITCRQSAFQCGEGEASLFYLK